MRSRKARPRESRAWVLLAVQSYFLVFVVQTRGVQGSSETRHLLAASAPGPGGACGLQLQGVTKTFTQCQSLTSELGEEYAVLWTYTPLAASNASGRLDVAIDAPAKSNSWIGFGIPKTPDAMLGASAIIVRTNASAPSGASGAQYLLGGYSVSKVVPGGVLTVQNLTSAFSNGRLQATFTLAQASPIDSSIPIIVAVGPLKADGSLQQHSASVGAQLPIGTPPSAAAAAGPPATSPSAAASLTPQSAVTAADPPATSPSATASLTPQSAVTAADPPASSAAPQTAGVSPTPAVAPAPAAAPGGGCGLQFQGATKTFSQCQSLESDLGDDYTVLWNYTPLAATSAGPQGRLDVGIDAAANPNSYVGFGIPQEPDTMIGASAIIVKTDAVAPSGASATQYLLGGYSVDQIKPGGNLMVQNLTSAFSKGRLQALFTLAQVPSSDSNVPIIVAFGPLTAAGGLQQHESAVGAKLATVAGGAAPATSPSGTAPMTTQDVSAQPPAASINTLGIGAQPPGASLMASGSPAESPAAALAPAASGGCTLTAPGVPARTFTQCTALTGAAPDFRLLWSVSDGKTPAGGRRLHASGPANVTFAVDAAKPDGWIGVGIPATPGQMVGANAMFFRVCPNCTTGARADWRYLAGKNTAGVQGAGRIPVDNVQAWAADGRILGSFSLEVDPATLEGQPLIYASGPVSPSGTCLYHADGQGGITVDLASGGVSGGGGISNLQELSTAHGWIMAVSWGFLIPLGAVIARNFKTLGATWFNIHRVVQILGWLLGWAGFGIGVHITTSYNLHQRLGIAIQILGTIQVFLAVAARPSHLSRWRRPWNLGHWWVGRVAIGLAIANVYLGLIDEAAEETKYVVAYSVVLGAIVVTALAKESYDYVSLPPPAVDCARAPHYLSTDPVTGAKPYAGLLIRRGARPRDGRGAVSLVDRSQHDNDSVECMTSKA